MPPTQYPHAEIIQRLIRRFDRQIDERRVSVLGSNFGLMITRDPLTCRCPDLALYWRDKIVVEDGKLTAFSEADAVADAAQQRARLVKRLSA